MMWETLSDQVLKSALSAVLPFLCHIVTVIWGLQG